MNFANLEAIASDSLRQTFPVVEIGVYSGEHGEHVTGGKRMKRAFAGVFVLGLSAGLWSLGCGGASGEDYTMLQHPANEGAPASAWTMPEAIVEDMRTCARE
ncbi:MAG TPA: hypothetical protein PK156_31865, partial [Polyangium sp.]|nr:hypothetical protein [Polyangium sp.]